MVRCNKCKNVGLHIAPDILLGTNGILVVGESPKGQLDDCLSAPTMRRLALNLDSVGITLSECYFTEICKCELLNRRDLLTVGYTCISLLESQIIKYNPKIVITIGITANIIFSKHFNIEPGIGKATKLRNFDYWPLWHTSPINPHGYERNKKILLTYSNN